MSDKYRRRINRFKPREEINWLDYDQRASHRNTIRILSDLATRLERQVQLTPEQEALVLSLTQSEARDTRLNASWSFLEKTEAHYMTLLAAMAPFELTAYHELMNPHEPPDLHHIYLCQHFQKVEAGEIALLGVSLPPGSAKSTYGSRSFAQWMIGRHPDKRILALGHSQKFVEDEFSKPNRNAVDSEMFQLAFPDVQLSEAERGASMWKLDGWRGSYACRGALAGVSGLRAHLVDADDMYKSAADALSEIISANIWRWFAADVMSRRLPGAPVVLTNTRWTSHDVIGQLEKLAKENPKSIPQPAVFINIPAQAEENDPLGRAPGEWLWANFYTAEHYETLRATMPPSLWSALYLGKPLDQHGDFVSEDDFQRYEAVPMNREGHPPQFAKTVMSVDTAQKSKERSNYCAIGVYRRGVDGYHYMVDNWRGKKNLDNIIKQMSQMIRNWGVNYAIIEDAGMGTQILENYQGKMPAPLVRYTPISQASKEFRFDASAPYITTGKILFPKQAPWLTDFINELVAFPYGEYDDNVDQFSQYVEHEMKIKVGGTKKLRMRA